MSDQHPVSSIQYFMTFFFLFSISTNAQTYLSQTIKGTIIDEQTKAPLVGASVILLFSDPLIGTTTDINGNFTLGKVPVGKQQVKVTFIGYAPFISAIISVTSAKESVINIELQEMVFTSGEVEIKADYRKYEAINKMAAVSIRSFSVDETFRFAGSYGDPGRMAANFAGVTSGIDNRNDIIVRGNSPSGMQWRLDDMEIPNPNHFAAVGTTGGPVTVLNDNLLTNSDFLTGAFPAEYGNSIAGIFDLKMRSGNNEKYEFWGQIGWNGIELGAEGPFSKKSRASFLISYRYSLLACLDYIGIKMDVVPKYQDLNFKITIPTKKAGTFNVTGMGGLSYIELFDSRRQVNKWTFPEYGQDLANGSNLGVIGISHTCFFNPTFRLKTNLYVTGSKVYTSIDTFNIIQRERSPWAGEKSEEVKYSFSARLFKKFSSKNTFDAGFLADWYQMHFSDSVMLKSKFRVNTGSRENMQLIRIYSQWQHKFSDFLSTTVGANFQYLTLNGSNAIEPRFGLNWILNEHHTINFGSGLYSQMQPRVIYFVRALLPDGSYVQTNRNLDFTRSFQVATSYNYLINNDIRFKAEVYYQYLYDLAVKASIPQYAVINEGHDFFIDRQYSDSLVNHGTGENYGIEFTMEKFFSKNYFFLLTATIFNSKYLAYDKIVRNTTFNANYAFNAVAGYEFKIGRRKLGVMSFGLRGTWAGGNPYIPFDVDKTIATRETVLDWQDSYNPRYPDYKRISFRFGITRNRPGYNISFLVDLQYRTNYTNIYLQQIDVLTGKIYTFYSMGFFPMGTWRIQF